MTGGSGDDWRSRRWPAVTAMIGSSGDDRSRAVGTSCEATNDCSGLASPVVACADNELPQVRCDHAEGLTTAESGA
jgi:hypothetical protein